MGHTHYHIPFILELSAMNFLYAVSAGSFFCICSVVFSGLIHNISNLLKEKISFLPLRPVTGGIVVAVAVFSLGTNKYIGLGIPTIVESFTTMLSVYDSALKILFTAVTLGAAFKGGEVTTLFS